MIVYLDASALVKRYVAEVICYFDPHDPEAERYASTCEDGLPEYWDDMARQEIKQAEEERR